MSGDAHLAVQFRPKKDQSRVWVRDQFLPLAALVVGEENEPASVKSFEQNHSGGRYALRCGRRERHRGGFFAPGALGEAEPLLKQQNGIWGVQ